MDDGSSSSFIYIYIYIHLYVHLETLFDWQEIEYISNDDIFTLGFCTVTNLTLSLIF
jgi:hypothetical protein